MKIFGDCVPVQRRSRRWSSSPIMPTRRSCWSGCVRSVAGRTTYLVHGDADASWQLRELMQKELGWRVEVAQYLEKVEV